MLNRLLQKLIKLLGVLDIRYKLLQLLKLILAGLMSFGLLSTNSAGISSETPRDAAVETAGRILAQKQ